MKSPIEQELIAVPVTGMRLLNHPSFNKDHAFTLQERESLGLLGLLSAREMSIEEQVAVELMRVRQKPNDLERYIGLAALQDRNETLFYRLLVENIEELMPLVYTPTVGLACQNYSRILRRSRGLWITPADSHRMPTLLRNVPHQDIKLIVVTDNERILGLGDQGCGGMGIPIGKLALYSAAAGIHPQHTLPISLDVGTDNPGLLADPYYLGFAAPRLRGEAYAHFIEAFVNAVAEVFPKAVVQWEDFQRDAALANLQRYRHRITSFNDDIQGTAAVALAGILATNRFTQRSLHDTRIVFVGSGSAGSGIGELLRLKMQQSGLDAAQIARNLVFMDSRGLVVEGRKQLPSDPTQLLIMSAQVAQSYGLQAREGIDLETVVAAVKPTVLLGTAAQPNVFSEQAIRTMAAHCPRPLIMPFSNPTTKAECLPEHAIAWSDGRALVASGSPFQPVHFAGKTHLISQGNNVFVFPGIGLGAVVSQARTIVDEMFLAAADTLAAMLTPALFAQGAIYPQVSDLRKVAQAIAECVVREAANLHLGKQIPEAAIADAVNEAMWYPNYPAYQSE